MGWTLTDVDPPAILTTCLIPLNCIPLNFIVFSPNIFLRPLKTEGGGRVILAGGVPVALRPVRGDRDLQADKGARDRRPLPRPEGQHPAWTQRERRTPSPGRSQAAGGGVSTLAPCETSLPLPLHWRKTTDSDPSPPLAWDPPLADLPSAQGIGKEHAKFIPTCTVAMAYMPDIRINPDVADLMTGDQKLEWSAAPLYVAPPPPGAPSSAGWPLLTPFFAPTRGSDHVSGTQGIRCV